MRGMGQSLQSLLITQIMVGLAGPLSVDPAVIGSFIV